MHPYLAGAMAQAHIEDLHAEAARFRLAAEARAAHPAPVHAWWSRQVSAFQRVLAARVQTRAPQPVCCPA